MQAITGAKLFSPGKIGHMELRNRVGMAPMVVQLAAESGAVTARSIDYYARRAKGGAGLVIVEATWIASEGKAFACQVGLDGRPCARNLQVLVLGGRQMGCETAEYLAERGNSVTLVSRSPAADLAGDVVASYRAPLRARLRKLSVMIHTRCDVRELADGKATLVDAHGGEEAVVGADLVVLARGSLSQPTWVDELRKKVPELYVVGDCVEPRDIASALYGGAWAGSQI